MRPYNMQISDFDYILPKDLVAQRPLKERDSSRLMVMERKEKKISHRIFRDLPNYLVADDVLVLNDTKVAPCRIIGRKARTFGRVDALLVRRLSDKRYEALLKPSLKNGQRIIFTPLETIGQPKGRMRSLTGFNHGNIEAEVSDRKVLEFNIPLSDKLLNEIGLMPLPPYIKRLPQDQDVIDYQTVYAKKRGAIASPTAGLHFTKRLLNQIKEKEVKITELTLHVGVGTFKPVKCPDISQHKMEKEEFIVPIQTIKAIRTAKENKKRIFAVGTTTARVLETAADIIFKRTTPSAQRTAHSAYTDLFIYPGYKFKAVDCLLTNFHLPKTTLFMLVCAFAGRDLMMQAYEEAIKERYRFYSYGDAMLIL